MTQLPWKKTPPRDRIQADEVFKKAQESLTATRKQQSYVNQLTAYLENRKGQNGFGEDFDITIRHPRRPS